jgi:hypothetical protein
MQLIIRLPLAMAGGLVTGPVAEVADDFGSPGRQ